MSTATDKTKKTVQRDTRFVENLNQEQMNAAQFRNWLRLMDYPQKPEMSWLDKIPYSHEAICNDLGIRANRFYSYWRGVEKGKPVRVSPSVTRLCRVLLANRTTEKLVRKMADENPDLVPMVDQILKTLSVPRMESGSRRRNYEGIDPEVKEQIDHLRERAVVIRRAAASATTAALRERMRLDAEELEDRASKLEEGHEDETLQDWA